MSGSSHTRVLVVFGKDPRPGEVKTRMTPALSPQLAAAFYREMLSDVLEESARACATLDLDGILAASPPTALSALAATSPQNFRVVAQSGPDLGARMAFEVLRAFAAGARRVVLRGSDNPALGVAEIAALYRALDTADLAVCPDLDGGYGAIGLRVPGWGIFDHPMSTRDVLQKTLDRAKAAGLVTHCCEPSFDLDTVGDLSQLADVRETLPAERCPRSLAFADRHSLWPPAAN